MQLIVFLPEKIGYSNPELFSLNNEEFLKAYASDFYNRKIENGEMYCYQHNFAREKEEVFSEVFSIALDPVCKRFRQPNTIKYIKDEIIKKYERHLIIKIMLLITVLRLQTLVMPQLHYLQRKQRHQVMVWYHNSHRRHFCPTRLLSIYP
ncbi:hypothetical protein [Candidatus Williamhamiltonella defendens]|uniref:hypothetical protein n=1 Tax=Candidatus Williamhamiltonella defendens TaxID=138072 RepID=UPI0016513F23|nr:hypothetical protein [Candidatus Hamiltonella defensa]